MTDEPAPSADVGAAVWPGESRTDVSAKRLRRLARVIAELAAAPDFETVVDVAVAYAGAAVDAIVATLSVLEGSTLKLAGIHGGRSDTPDKWSVYLVSANVPTAQAVRERRVVIASGSAEIRARYPSLTGDFSEERSIVCLPLLVRGRVIGAIGMLFSGLWNADDRQLEFLTTFADACAQALDRLEALELARENAAKLKFLADASAELSSSLDFRTTLANVAQLAVPSLADWCAVEIVEDGEPRTLAVAHVDPAKVALAEELQQRYPPDPNSATGVRKVLRTGRSELIPRVTDEMLVAAARDSEHLRLARELRLHSALMVPLVVRGRVLGVLTLVWAESGRAYDEGDVAFAEDVARRAAIAIDNAQLHSETLQAAIRLQHAVLPESLPRVAGWQMAACYQPAGRTEVGGDFYDAIACDGDVALVVGDVMGRGVAAAAAMAQMRSAVRAYAAIDPDPQTLLSKLDRLFEVDEIAQLVTLVYCLSNWKRGEVSLVNAGHLPPMLVTEGGARLLELPVSLPLGVQPDMRRAVTIPFPVGATLLAFTDGLVERRGEDIDVGLARAREHAGVLASGPLETALASFVAELRNDRLIGGEASDDITVFALRRVGAT